MGVLRSASSRMTSYEGKLKEMHAGLASLETQLKAKKEDYASVKAEDRLRQKRRVDAVKAKLCVAAHPVPRDWRSDPSCTDHGMVCFSEPRKRQPNRPQ